jgi:hypothetical protein
MGVDVDSDVIRQAAEALERAGDEVFDRICNEPADQDWTEVHIGIFDRILREHFGEMAREAAALEKVVKAFTNYINDYHRHAGLKDPPVLGICMNCGHPVYESDHGGGFFHYGYRPSEICGQPDIAAVEAAKERA